MLNRRTNGMDKAKSQVRILLEILHRVENDHCMECPEQEFPCRTLSLLDCGEMSVRIFPEGISGDHRE